MYFVLANDYTRSISLNIVYTRRYALGHSVPLASGAYNRPHHYPLLPPSVDRLPPNTAGDFQVPNMFFLVLYDYLYRPFATPESGGTGGWTVYHDRVGMSLKITSVQYTRQPSDQ